MRVAVLGMGRMGRALAARLLDTGNEVTVWNSDVAAAVELLRRR
ncbi:MAG: NAD(P)-binding domain-containing protein [Actinomycetota bacterium]|nr:NAD(P)-binding domain-containing protein [Actinomycetota bacterium]